MKHVLLMLLLLPGILFGETQRRLGRFSYPPTFEGARAETYRKVGDTELKLWVFEEKAAGMNRPAVVFFFGGGWQAGSPAQFERHARYLAARGMVAMVADYRVASRNRTKPTECLADAKACVRWIRTNAERMGIDTNRIAAAGGSAGGHLAAAIATVPGLDAETEANVSCVPDALVLFNPALVLAPFEGVAATGFGTNFTKDRLGCPPEELSPIHHVRKGTPPTIIFHGTADTTVPYSTAERFAAHMKALGNRCDLIGYEGQPHGFFNTAKFEETLAATDAFFASLGWINPKK